MSIETTTRFRSNDVCSRAGRYGFDGYVDGGWQPAPLPSELATELSVGDRFPAVRSSGKACWWVYLGVSALVEDETR